MEKEEKTPSWGKKLSRRRFLTGLLGAVILVAAGGGYRVARHAFSADEADGELSVRHLRQIVAADNAHGRILMFQTEEPLTEPALEWREDEGKIMSVEALGESFTDDGATQWIYGAELSDLPQGKNLLYRIHAKEGAGDWHPLQTDDGERVKALIFPDSQSSDYTDWTGLVRGAWERNGDSLLFINMGDLVDNGEDKSQWEAWLNAVSPMIDRIPLAPIMGNHETYNLDWKVRLPLAYLALFQVPENGSEKFPRYYYSFDYGPCHFTVLNTQLGETEDFKEGLLEEQLTWLDKDVQSTKKPWKIVLMHKDPLQYRIHNRPERQEGFSDEGHAFMPHFDRLGIDLVLSAHLHTYRNRGHIKNFQRDEAGPLYILTGVAGNVRYPGLWVDHALDVYVAPQPETDNYLTLAADKETLEVASFLPDGTELDRTKLTKN